MQGKNNNKQDKMSYEGFCKCIQIDLEKQLSGLNITVQLLEVEKNNGQKQMSVIIKEEGKSTSPTIYLDSFYEFYLTGMDIRQVEKQIAKYYTQNSGFKFDAKKFTEWETVKKKIIYKLVNFEKNKALLETIPYRKFLDLAITYCCLVEDMQGDNSDCATIQIKNEHLKFWHKITEEDLYSVAVKNTPILLPIRYNNILDVMAKNFGCENVEMPEVHDNSLFMNVLTNSRYFLGSATILYPNLLHTIAERIGADLYILPSSIHEVIILPAIKDSNSAILTETVKYVNENELPEVDFLSNNVYFYSREKDEISIYNGVTGNDE